MEKRKISKQKEIFSLPLNLFALLGVIFLFVIRILQGESYKIPYLIFVITGLWLIAIHIGYKLVESKVKSRNKIGKMIVIVSSVLLILTGAYILLV